MRQYRIDNKDRKAYPFGLTHVEGGIHVSVAAEAKQCSLVLFDTSSEPERIPFPEEGRIGNVWEMTLRGKNLDRCEYAFEADGKLFSDPYGYTFTGHEEWGNPEHACRLLCSPVCQAAFDWEDDAPPRVPYEECIVYRIHVRGFTRHSSSGVKDKGTFRGIIEKIPYLKELGITTLEIMMPVEFSEVIMEGRPGRPSGKEEPTGRLNYWGYGPALNGAPKASYAGKRRQPDVEMKNLVRELHRAGIELVVELFFTGKEPPVFVLDMARRWVQEYHVDGLHLTGNVPLGLLAQDPYLAETKLWASSWNGQEKKEGSRRHLGEYNDGFLIDMRRVLKGDEGQMNALAFHTRHNPAEWGTIQYLANTNGFTMMDLVCYDQKHNEDNGEKNLDGSDYNYSWNCGVEGPARRKRIVELRRQQLRNAFLLLFLSQGTPLLMAGDEFGNSQNGNNNAYCQDNSISWINWNQKKSNGDLLAFVKEAIRFRKAHPVFRKGAEPRMMDYQSCGFPDVSYHGTKAWFPEFDHFRRQLGILYCGDYEVKPDGAADDYFFVAYNMHWEPHEFALPHLPRGMCWHVAFDTGDGAHNGYFEPGQEPKVLNQKQKMVLARTIVVLIGRKPAEEPLLETENEEEAEDAHV